MTQDERPEGARTFRASSGPVALIISALLALFLLGDAVVRGSWGQMLLLAPWVLLALWVVYEISFVSHVRVDDARRVRAEHARRNTSFGWSRVRDIDLRWQLVFSLDDGTDVTCYGGPARSRPVRSRSRGDEEPKAPAGLRELTRLRDRWEAADSADSAADAPIRRSWDGRR